MQRIAPALIAVLALTGCIYTPQELREVATPYPMASSRDSKSLANCLARNAANMTYLVNMAEGDATGTYQLVLQIPSAMSAHVLIEVLPAGGGARAVIYPTPALLTRESTLAKLSGGC